VDRSRSVFSNSNTRFVWLCSRKRCVTTSAHLPGAFAKFVERSNGLWSAGNGASRNSMYIPLLKHTPPAVAMLIRDAWLASHPESRRCWSPLLGERVLRHREANFRRVIGVCLKTRDWTDLLHEDLTAERLSATSADNRMLFARAAGRLATCTEGNRLASA
jgi:hypothetical protein